MYPQLWQWTELVSCFLHSWRTVVLMISLCLQRSPFFTMEPCQLVSLLRPFRKYLHSEHIFQISICLLEGSSWHVILPPVEVKGQLIDFSFRYSIDQTQVVKLNDKHPYLLRHLSALSGFKLTYWT